MATGIAKTSGGAIAVALIGGTLYVSGVLELGDTVTVGDFTGTVVGLYNVDQDPDYDCVDLEEEGTGRILRLALETQIDPDDVSEDTLLTADWIPVYGDLEWDDRFPCGVPPPVAQ